MISIVLNKDLNGWVSKSSINCIYLFSIKCNYSIGEFFSTFRLKHLLYMPCYSFSLFDSKFTFGFLTLIFTIIRHVIPYTSFILYSWQIMRKIICIFYTITNVLTLIIFSIKIIIYIRTQCRMHSILLIKSDSSLYTILCF